MIDITAGPAKLGVNVPELNRRFKDNVLDIAGLHFARGLVFYVDVMSVVLNTNYLVSGSPLQIPLCLVVYF